MNLREWLGGLLATGSVGAAAVASGSGPFEEIIRQRVLENIEDCLWVIQKAKEDPATNQPGNISILLIVLRQLLLNLWFDVDTRFTNNQDLDAYVRFIHYVLAVTHACANIVFDKFDARDLSERRLASQILALTYMKAMSLAQTSTASRSGSGQEVFAEFEKAVATAMKIGHPEAAQLFPTAPQGGPLDQLALLIQRTTIYREVLLNFMAPSERSVESHLGISLVKFYAIKGIADHTLLPDLAQFVGQGLVALISYHDTISPDGTHLVLEDSSMMGHAFTQLIELGAQIFGWKHTALPEVLAAMMLQPDGAFGCPLYSVKPEIGLLVNKNLFKILTEDFGQKVEPSVKTVKIYCRARNLVNTMLGLRLFHQSKVFANYLEGLSAQQQQQGAHLGDLYLPKLQHQKKRTLLSAWVMNPIVNVLIEESVRITNSLKVLPKIDSEQGVALLRVIEEIVSIFVGLIRARDYDFKRYFLFTAQNRPDVEFCTILLNFFLQLVHIGSEVPGSSEALVHDCLECLTYCSYVLGLGESQPMQMIANNIGDGLAECVSRIWRSLSSELDEDLDDLDARCMSPSQSSIRTLGLRDANAVFKGLGNDRYLYRIGLVGVTCRIYAPKILPRFIDTLRVAAASTAEGDERLECLRFTFFFMTELLTSSTGDLARAPDWEINPQTFYSKVGDFSAGAASIPSFYWNFNAEEFDTAILQLFSVLFEEIGIHQRAFLESISGPVAQGMIVMLSRFASAFLLNPMIPDRRLPVFRTKTSAVHILSLILQTMVTTLYVYSGDHPTIDTAVKGIGTLVAVGVPEERGLLWSIPVFQTEVRAKLLAVDGFRKALLPKPMMLLAQTVTSAACQTLGEQFLQGKQNLIQWLYNCRDLLKMRHIASDEGALITCCAILRGVIRGTLRRSDRPFDRVMEEDFELFTTWLFSDIDELEAVTANSQPLESMHNYLVKRAESKCLVAHVDWISQLSCVDTKCSPKLHTQIVSLLKVVYVLLSTKIHNRVPPEQYDGATEAIQGVLRNQLIGAWGIRNPDEDEFEWLKSIFAFFTQMCVLTKERTHVGEIARRSQSLTVTPFLRKVIEEAHINGIMVENEEGTLFGNFLLITKRILLLRSTEDFCTLTSPAFIQNLFRLLTQHCESSGNVKGTASDLMLQLAVSQCMSSRNPETSELAAMWAQPAAETLKYVIVQLISSTIPRAVLTNWPDFIYGLLLILASYPDLFTQTLNSLLEEIQKVEPRLFNNLSPYVGLMKVVGEREMETVAANLANPNDPSPARGVGGPVSINSKVLNIELRREFETKIFQHIVWGRGGD